MASLLINIDVPELEQGIAFYTAAFELRLSRRLGSGFVELLGGGSPIYLLQTDAGSRPFRDASAGRDFARHWTPGHIPVRRPGREPCASTKSARTTP